MTIHNISWDIAMNDIINDLDNMSIGKAAKVLDVPVNRYANMNISERHDYAYEVFENNPGKYAEHLHLPESLDIPDKIGHNEEDIKGYLSDKYGYDAIGVSCPEEEYELPFC